MKCTINKKILCLSKDNDLVFDVNTETNCILQIFRKYTNDIL